MLLPLDVRLLIYEEVFLCARTSAVLRLPAAGGGASGGAGMLKCKHPSLVVLALNRQIHNESLAVLHRAATFVFSLAGRRSEDLMDFAWRPGGLSHFLQGYGPLLAGIRRVEVGKGMLSLVGDRPLEEIDICFPSLAQLVVKVGYVEEPDAGM
jgi:hypothetical protein